MAESCANVALVCAEFRIFVPVTGMISQQSVRYGAALGLLAIAVWGCLTAWPPLGGYVWDPLFINITSSLLFTLLVALTARLVGTSGTLSGFFGTALFLILFCPGGERFFVRDEAALQELSSQCIVPFFIMQYMRVSHRNFHKWYFMMLLMGIFCSYTHNGVTIPLCAAFVWASFVHRKNFFRRACWPMVTGFVLGTALSLWSTWAEDYDMVPPLPPILDTRWIHVLQTLWDTKIIVLGLGLKAYLITTREGRVELKYVARRHYMLSSCLLMSWLFLPFAPLGIDNAITGLCFFSMLWTMVMVKHLVLVYFHKII